jgi:hypothetical protein
MFLIVGPEREYALKIPRFSVQRLAANDENEDRFVCACVRACVLPQARETGDGP